MSSSGSEPVFIRLRLTVRGLVQGVGFRPFVYRLATELALTGYVQNTGQGVELEVEGEASALDLFLDRFHRDKPPAADYYDVISTSLPPGGATSFVIRASRDSAVNRAQVLPDLATCEACRAELFDPADRRYRYPFTNCTHCGPRFSIIARVPYDRAHTTMHAFDMCPTCRAEYEDPASRRFHAQPNACPDCGPQLEAWDPAGPIRAEKDEALLLACEALRAGKIVAVKGLGGFQLMVDARSNEAVARLRERKHREEKPFALIYPTLAAVQAEAHVNALEQAQLLSTQAPIVLLQKKHGSSVSDEVAPGYRQWGAMLPYTPLHHLLLHEMGCPLVATSGNRSDEPICIDEHQAVERLHGIADLFLVHNRPILRHVDDSVVMVAAGREMVLRRARGYAPLPVELCEDGPPLLAVGAQLKNTVAVSNGHSVFISQHIGDLETESARHAFAQAADDLQRLHQVEPERVAHDLHPDYVSTRYAREQALPAVAVQHHYAHVLAVMEEHRLDGPVLGVAWDGTGYGIDGTVWGGEFLITTRTGFERAGHLRTFPLPGGEQAIREPRRCALGLLHAWLGSTAAMDTFDETERRVLTTMMEQQINAPLTSSIGRLFDAVSALLGLCQVTSFEGQAAMQLEALADPALTGEAYPVAWTGPEDGPLVLDGAPALAALLRDRADGVAPAAIASRFHNMLVESVVEMAGKTEPMPVILTGGCFQNRLLLERAVTRLREERIEVYWPRQLPPNDGGIALGQAVAASQSGEPRMNANRRDWRRMR